MALKGEHSLHVVLYDGSDGELFSESQVVDVDFTAYMGAIQPLDVSMIEEAASVGIAVDDGMQMARRIPFGSVPFAMHTPQLPPGMVAFFDSSTYPTYPTRRSSLGTASIMATARILEERLG